MSQLVEPVGVVLINQTRKVVKSTNDDNSTTRKVPTGPTDTHDWPKYEHQIVNEVVFRPEVL